MIVCSIYLFVILVSHAEFSYDYLEKVQSIVTFTHNAVNFGVKF